MAGRTTVMNQYTDEQLKQALAKMLPEKILYLEFHSRLFYQELDLLGRFVVREILDTELLQLCFDVEETLSANDYEKYGLSVAEISGLTEDSSISLISRALFSMKWQQRVVALAKVKEIEI